MLEIKETLMTILSNSHEKTGAQKTLFSILQPLEGTGSNEQNVDSGSRWKCFWTPTWSLRRALHCLWASVSSTVTSEKLLFRVLVRLGIMCIKHLMHREPTNARPRYPKPGVRDRAGTPPQSGCVFRVPLEIPGQQTSSPKRVSREGGTLFYKYLDL